MSDPVDVLVAVPAHDEADSISACLASVVDAIDAARDSGVVGRARIAVAAHRCTDQTAHRARAVLRASGVEWLVAVEAAALPVGAVRTRLIRHAMQQPPPLGTSCWVFSTDADTVVPVEWVTGLLAVQHQAGADLVLGLAELDSWLADGAAWSAYRALLESGMGDVEHSHAYAANLAVRWSMLSAVGGFPGVPHGEEHALAAQVRAAGGRVVSPLAPIVRTSGRMPGRAAHGLGDLLERLARRVGPEDSAAPG